jgi:streptogramin lyase
MSHTYNCPPVARESTHFRLIRPSARRLTIMSVVVMVAASVSVPTAWAGSVTEFPVAGEPSAITAGPDGNVWFTDAGAFHISHTVGKITPAGKITYYSAGISGEPFHITAGPDGNVWFTEVTGNGGNDVAKITPAGAVTEFNITPATTEINGHPSSITAGPDGNLWFTGMVNQCTRTGTPSVPPAVMATVTEYCGPHLRIGKITPAGVTTDYTTGATAEAESITAGPDGNLWFTQIGPESEGIGKITTAGAPTEYSLGGTSVHALDITAGPDGNLWFTESLTNRIGKIRPAGAITYYSLGERQLGPSQITAGPDGNLWFTAGGLGHRIGRITTSGSVTYYSLGSAGERAS